jgi:hypothetical protein
VGLIEDFVEAADSVYDAVTDNPVTRQLDSWGKDVGFSTLTDPFKGLAKDIVASDAGLFLARVWATHAATWFQSPAAFLMLGPAAPALGVFMLAMPSRARGETSFGRAYAQQVVWAINTGAKIIGSKGIEIPEAEITKLVNLDAELVRSGAAKLAEMKGYGVDVEAMGQRELMNLVGTDRPDLAYLARAAATESPADLERAAEAQAGIVADIAAEAADNARAIAETDRRAARAAAIARGQNIVERADNIARGQALIDASNAAQQWETADRKPRRSHDVLLGLLILGAVGAVAWWAHAEAKRT